MSLVIFEKPSRFPCSSLRAVPALVLEAALRHCDLQFVVGPAPVDGVLRVEAREVLPDDLLGPVALDPFGPRVPGGDVALRVEHEDGVIEDAFHQEPEPLLAPTKGLLGPLPLRQISGDFREAHQIAPLAPQRRDDDVGPEP
jgi:hypothetical protein